MDFFLVFFFLVKDSLEEFKIHGQTDSSIMRVLRRVWALTP